MPKPSNAWVLDELFRAFATGDDALRLDVLKGLEDVYRGRRSVTPPPGWKDYHAALAASESADVRDRALELAVLFGDERQLQRLEGMVLKRERADLAQRRRALALLVAKRDPAFGKSVLTLLREPELRPDAIRALAAYDLAEIPPRLVAEYAGLSPAERQDAIQTLTARPAFALALLDAIDGGVIPRSDVSALVIRQLQSLDNSEVNAALKKIWGEIRPASADKQARIGQFKEQLAAEDLASANLARGRAIYAKSCGACHKLFDAGGRVGPELTGSQRKNLDYLLDNVLDPSAIVPREYRASVLRLADGRVVQGVVQQETPQMLVVETPNETLRVPAGDVQARKESALSMMPEGLFDRLAADELRDLVAYLASPEQVPAADDKHGDGRPPSQR
jgi:putative heme-binding domain-containing protein